MKDNGDSPINDLYRHIKEYCIDRRYTFISNKTIFYLSKRIIEGRLIIKDLDRYLYTCNEKIATAIYQACKINLQEVTEVKKDNAQWFNEYWDSIIKENKGDK